MSARWIDVVAAAGGALLLTACGDAFEGGTEAQGGGGGSGGATTTSQGTGGDSAPEIGCADGERELFEDPAAEPNVAGCAGGFGEPGVIRPETKLPKCNRGAGDDGDNPSGNGCTVADLCAAGWHVCDTQVEVASKLSVATGCPAEPALSFWITGQAQDAMAQCDSGPTVVNNVVGCGADWGLAAHASCAPLDRVMQWSHCAETMVWECGDMGDPNQEANLIRKNGPEEGGVLCCHN